MDNAIHGIHTMATGGSFGLKLLFQDIKVEGKTLEVHTGPIHFDDGPERVRDQIESSFEAALFNANKALDYKLNLQLLENDPVTSQPTPLSQPTADDGTPVHGVVVLAKEKGHALGLVERVISPSIILKLQFVIRIV